MSTKFSAKEPALGYYYQIIRGLVLLLEENRMESPVLSFECMDDISIVNPEETNLFQTKLHVRKAQLTDRSTDFWKTIRVWSEGITNGTFLPEKTIFTLITTANYSTDTFITKFGREDEKDRNEILQTMTTISQEIGNAANEKGYRAFMALTEEQMKMLIKNIRIANAEMSVPDTINALRKRLELSAPSWSLDRFVDEIMGWWFLRSVELLASHGSILSISRESLRNQIDAQRDQIQAEVLPDDYNLETEVGEADVEQCSSKTYIKQLDIIDATKREKIAAIRDYTKAYGQRSKWLRDGRVSPNEYEEFEAELRYDWSDRFGLIQDQTEGQAEEERKQAGHEFYRDNYIIIPSLQNVTFVIYIYNWAFNALFF